MSKLLNILVGDIGGTNSRLMLVELNDDKQLIRAKKTYQNANFTSLISVIEFFLSEHKIEKNIYSVCLAVAGPVINGNASITNLPWTISEKELGDSLASPRVKLINDFIAVAYGITALKQEDIVVLQKGNKITPAEPNPAIAVIGAGTGLGAAHLIYQSDHYQALSSEAGHAGFTPESKIQTRLLTWLQQEFSHVSQENVLSGRGLTIIYQFLHQIEGIEESAEVNNAMLTQDPASVISEYGLKNIDLLCQETLDLFIDIYGATAGNIVLHYFPLTEVYIAGGIAVKIKDKMLAPRFIDAFNNKGLMSGNMKNVSIKLVLNDNVGLLGALENVKYIFKSEH